MSFLFKSKKQQPPAFAPPRLVSSSHGPNSAGASRSGPSSASAGHTPATPVNPLQIASANSASSPAISSDQALYNSKPQQPQQQQQQQQPTQTLTTRRSDNDLGRTNGTTSAQAQQRPPPSSHTEKYYYPIDPSSPFPWSLRLTNYTPAPGQSYDAFPPLPRYGASVNAVCDKDKQIFMFGGLMGTEPTNDLWILDCSGLVKTVGISDIDDRMKADLAVPKYTDTGTVFTSLSFRKVKAKGKVPSERVGHAALLAGNAFIVFGGDTPTKVNDKLDDTLYFFNTAENQMSWTAPECRNRPAGRYGHTLSLIGNHIYLFGGQCEHIFFNDVHAYDLNKIQSDPSWVQIKNPAGSPCPPPRTNHSVITWNNKMYLFGGTDGVNWYNDVWSFDPATRSWTEMSCIGYIPLAREGHAAALVDDMMYVIGGRVRDGVALRELAAFKISSGRWFSFQNMGIPPSARSGHSMTTVDNQVVTIGGHSDALEINELRYAYILDTRKIAFDSAPAAQRQTTAPVQTSRKNTAETVTTSRSQTPSHQQSDSVSTSRLPRATGPNGSAAAAPVPGHTRLASTGRNTPMAHPENEPKRSASSLGHGEGANGTASGSVVSRARSMSKTKDSQPQYQPYNPAAVAARDQTVPTSPDRTDAPEPREVRSLRTTTRSATDPSANMTVATSAKPATAVPAPVNRSVRPAPAPASVPTPVDSGIGSYGSSPVMGQSQPGHEEDADSKKTIDDLHEQIKRLQVANSWYAGEVALASKSGYMPSQFVGSAGSNPAGPRFSPSLDHRASISNPDSLLPQISEQDRPLVQLLLRTRTELASVQSRIDGESQKAANRIAEIEKQRDRAIEEVVYFKAKLASLSPIGDRGGSAASLSAAGRQSATPTPGADDIERASGLDRRLAEAVLARTSVSKELESAKQALEAEKRACAVAQETARASQDQMAALNSYQQRASSEIEGLKAQLHEANQRVRDELARANAADGREKMAQLEAAEAQRKLTSFLGHDAEPTADGEKSVDGESTTRSSAGSVSGPTKTTGFDAIITHLRQSVASSSERAGIYERRAKEERARAEEAEEAAAQARAELDQARVQVQKLTSRAEDAEALSEQHATEAERHRLIVVGGLEKLVERESSDHVAAFNAKIAVLETQLTEAEALVAKSLADTRVAEENVRQAQERIAGLETFQATTSLENLRVRDQLQAATAETSRLGIEIDSLSRKLDEAVAERDTFKIQLDTLTALVEERGLREDGESAGRMAELEHQLGLSNQARVELEAEWQKHEAELQAQWNARLDKLEHDYQTATGQVAGLEQVVAQMNNRNRRVEMRVKQFKELNHDLRTRLDSAERRLLSYLSQDMEPSAQDEDDDDVEPVDHRLMGSRQGLSTGSATGAVRGTGLPHQHHHRAHSSISLSSADDSGRISAGRVSSAAGGPMMGGGGRVSANAVNASSAGYYDSEDDIDAPVGPVGTGAGGDAPLKPAPFRSQPAVGAR